MRRKRKTADTRPGAPGGQFTPFVLSARIRDIRGSLLIHKSSQRAKNSTVISRTKKGTGGVPKYNFVSFVDFVVSSMTGRAGSIRGFVMPDREKREMYRNREMYREFPRFSYLSQGGRG